MTFATLTPLPQGDLFEGRVTSDRAGVPETPIAGVMMACPRAWYGSTRTSAKIARTENGFENILTRNDGVCFLGNQKSDVVKRGPASKLKRGWVMKEERRALKEDPDPKVHQRVQGIRFIPQRNCTRTAGIQIRHALVAVGRMLARPMTTVRHAIPFDRILP